MKTTFEPTEIMPELLGFIKFLVYDGHLPSTCKNPSKEETENCLKCMAMNLINKAEGLPEYSPEEREAAQARHNDDINQEICWECGASVAHGSGRFVNRIPNLDSYEERKANGYNYPEGAYLCNICENKFNKDK